MGVFNMLKKYKFRKTLKRLSIYGDFNDISLDTLFVFPDKIKIGSYIYIGPNASINGLGGVEIKNGTIIGPNLIIHSANHNFKNPKSIPYDENFEYRKVIIGENVWIGGNVIITPGSTIGEGCIIGAGAVVSGKIPPLSIVIGNPCQIIKKRDEEKYYSLKEQGFIYMKLKKELKTVQPNYE
ncbi:acyltransferase [Tenacibaculum finnmarkense]|uniref:acyltransferase n=1 Tax=Tenacibaculum finnmarkense TaxID=2781243 RepID=UPI001EFB6A2A|nr:acyltransferase [Tenacibaculum finnmarkense]MCG8236930.1 acyltransferase [Tenacibaculum finnmarkense genomovar ulcerans]MCG8749730.1 acyltransferase [Tenacibaculum finnmarkense]MCG8754847.1 acyltransferase [Tenacibaculum finnmarkense]MCG8783769.1 acyltransferase [Tenacibaculum finnmarkense]MCG8831038.1 acyltransferase [Tenacibaculum finnmarkense]